VGHSEADGAVFVADLDAKKIVKPVKVGPRPRSVAFTPDGTRAYVPSENGATLTKIDVKKLAPSKTIDLGKGMRPMGLRMSADGKTPLRQHRSQQDGARSGYGDG
jgi:DNA-binding beta-propeller fold protein YncE